MWMMWMYRGGDVDKMWMMWMFCACEVDKMLTNIP